MKKLPGKVIYADALIEHLDRCIEASKGLMRSVCVAIKCFVEQMPAADAVEVVHGRWEKCWQEKSKHYFRCSNCQMAYMDGVSGAIAPEYGSRAWRYCPNCGAKMDGDGNACNI